MTFSRMLTGALVVATLIGLAAPIVADPPKTESVQIGMAQTMFVDVPQPLVDILTYPFAGLMKEFTGLDGKLAVGGDCYGLAQKLKDGKVELAVFQGIEFAWVQSHYPEIKPLMIACYNHKHLHAYLVVNKDGPVNNFADLRGKEVAVPMRSKQHIRLFLNKGCAGCGSASAKQHCKNIQTPANPETTLDDLVAGKIDAAVIDKVGLDFYQFLKPGDFGRLKIVESSEAFPAAVVAYREGSIDETLLNRFKTGMIQANQSQRGRDMMHLFKITAFEPIPEDYQQTLDDIVKAYPEPESRVSTER